MDVSKRRERRKLVLLAVLLALLAGVLAWQWSRRERPVPTIGDQTEHRALATFMEMLEAGRLHGWRRTETYWETFPERRVQLYYQQLMGSRFRSEFTFQGSAPAMDRPGQVILYGMFDAGVPVEVRLAESDGEFKVVSMTEM